MQTPAATLPLSALLSQALVAFTIEFDNEFEHQMPHWTTDHGATGSTRGPWLVSMVMWWNCVRFVSEQGVRVGELEQLARTKTNLNGMTRWRYIVIEPDPADTRPKPPASDWVIRPTRWGRMAQQRWEPLPGIIEQRWIERFGVDYINQLRESLGALTRQFKLDLPDCLPILGYGLFSRLTTRQTQGLISHENLPLPALLSRALLAFALAFEHKSELSLAITANIVRLLAGEAMRIRDLPAHSGVSKESISMALGILEKGGLTVVEPDPAGGRSKLVRLTSKGFEAWERKSNLLRSIEDHWSERFGKNTVQNLRKALEQLSGEPLWRGLEPYPDNWRASVSKPITLPHYPMVLHRGGFPDGS